MKFGDNPLVAEWILILTSDKIGIWDANSEDVAATAMNMQSSQSHNTSRKT